MCAATVEFALGSDARVVYETCAPLTPENAVAGTPWREAVHAAPLYCPSVSYVLFSEWSPLHSSGQLREVTDVGYISATSVLGLIMRDVMATHTSDVRAAYQEVRCRALKILRRELLDTVISCIDSVEFEPAVNA